MSSRAVFEPLAASASSAPVTGAGGGGSMAKLVKGQQALDTHNYSSRTIQISVIHGSDTHSQSARCQADYTNPSFPAPHSAAAAVLHRQCTGLNAIVDKEVIALKNLAKGDLDGNAAIPKRHSVTNHSQYSLVAFPETDLSCGAGINPSINGSTAMTLPDSSSREMVDQMGTCHATSSDDDLPLLLIEEDLDHCHVPKPSVSHSTKVARQQLLISCFICAFFMIMEIVGGYLSNSLAIMTDAAHMLSDLASFMVSLLALWIGQKAPTKKMSFGFYRAEVLGAVSSVLLIWILTGILVFMAVDRVKYLDYTIDTTTMLVVSGCGVAMNIFMGLVLNGVCMCGKGSTCHFHSHNHGHSHSHSHHHSHGDPQNINVRAALVHVIGDLLQSIGVLIASLIIHFKPEYKIADPICTFIFSALVLATTFTIMRDSLYVLMEGFPRNFSYCDIKTSLLNIPGVKMVHSLHVWSLTVDKNALAVHLAIDQDVDSEKVLRTAEYLMRKKYGLYHSTIQVERFEPARMLNCDVCQGPLT